MRLLNLIYRFIDADLARQPASSAGSLILLCLILPWLAYVAFSQMMPPPVSEGVFIALTVATAVMVAMVVRRGWQILRAVSRPGRKPEF